MIKLLNEAAKERFREVVEFAIEKDLLGQLANRLNWLSQYGNHGGNPEKATGTCVLVKDLAPLSFGFSLFREGSDLSFCQGGLIYQGPEQPADGSFPSLTVSLSKEVGWEVHT